jgi:hypothetical protein
MSIEQIITTIVFWGIIFGIVTLMGVKLYRNYRRVLNELKSIEKSVWDATCTDDITSAIERLQKVYPQCCTPKHYDRVVDINGAIIFRVEYFIKTISV